MTVPRDQRAVRPWFPITSVATKSGESRAEGTPVPRPPLRALSCEHQAMAGTKGLLGAQHHTAAVPTGRGPARAFRTEIQMAKEGTSKGERFLPSKKLHPRSLAASPRPTQENKKEIRKTSISRAQRQNPAFAFESVIYSSCFITAEPSVDGGLWRGHSRSNNNNNKK